MINITILLAFIAVIQAWRLWQIVKPMNKKSHFKLKLEGTKKMIWDLEFKAFKTQEIREEIRVEYDHMCSTIDNFERQLKECKKDEKETIEDKITLAKRDKERLETQIGHLDLEVNGTKPTKEIPDGFTGIYSQIDSLRELVDMLKSWIKKI